MPGVKVTEVDLTGGGRASQGAPGVKPTIKDMTGGQPANGAPKVQVTERDLSKK